MDVYEETLLSSIMPDSLPDSWKDSNELPSYIQHLASCGISKLNNECDHIQEEQNNVLEQTKDLAYREYQTFIHAADCTKSTASQLSELEKKLSHTSDSVSNLHGTLSKFVATSRNLLASRQLNSTTLTKHTQLLEILELAQLLDTCVRNSYYDEGLEIIAYVRRLEKKHGHIPIIKSIVSEVQDSSQQMLSQLLSQLRSDISLPNCLKVVGLLRTLDVFTECQLRMKFLQARDGWLLAALRAVPHHEEYQYLSKMVESSRVHLFDIVTQYKAIFSDEDTRFNSLTDQDVNLQAILHSWILYKVSGILNLLKRSLAKGSIAGSNLEALLSQCMFFGQSLSRIGADFRCLIPLIFQEAAASQVERDIRTANHKFDESLSCFSLMDAHPISDGSGSVYMQHNQQSSSTRPPLALLEFPPLGHYMNALVSCFNTLRLCCFTALLPTVLAQLNTSLDKVIRSLVELQQVECSGFSAAEWSSFSRLCGVIHQVLVPHINVCLRSLFPLQHMASVTGCSVHQLSKQNFGQLDVEKICQPLQPFLKKTSKAVEPTLQIADSEESKTVEHISKESTSTVELPEDSLSMGTNDVNDEETVVPIDQQNVQSENEDNVSNSKESEITEAKENTADGVLLLTSHTDEMESSLVTLSIPRLTEAEITSLPASSLQMPDAPKIQEECREPTEDLNDPNEIIQSISDTELTEVAPRN